jgi:type II secretory pathway pseudopilin PulG
MGFTHLDRGSTPIETGFSLLEIVVALFVLVFGLLGLVQSMVVSNRLVRAADEKKLAQNFATEVLERVRTVKFGDITLAPPKGFVPTVAGTTATGFNQDLDADGDADFFGQFYSSNPVNANYDSLVLGLTPQSAGSVKAQLGFTFPAGTTMPVGYLGFRDPDGSTGAGIVEGTGFWVTVIVLWKGAIGDQSLKMSTFVTSR